MNIKPLYAFLSLILLLAISPYPLYAQESPNSFSEELGEFAAELENSEGAREDAAVARVESEEEATEAAKELLRQEVLYGEDGTGGAIGEFDAQTGGAGEALRTDASYYADGKKAVLEDGVMPVEGTAEGLTEVSDDSIRKGAYEDVELDIPMTTQSEYVLDYEIDQIETLLDQRLDLMDGVLTADINELDINPEYGFNADAWQEQVSRVSETGSSAGSGTANGEDISEQHEAIVIQEAENMALLYDNVVARDQQINSMVEKSQTLSEQGGVEINLDGLDEEVTNKLLHIDRKILDIMTEDAYEKDLAQNEDLLIHEITGLPLKGYAKRKALKELDGPYGKVEAMRARNLEGEVLQEGEILNLMMSIYDGYDPYAY